MPRLQDSRQSSTTRELAPWLVLLWDKILNTSSRQFAFTGPWDPVQPSEGGLGAFLPAVVNFIAEKPLTGPFQNLALVLLVVLQDLR